MVDIRLTAAVIRGAALRAAAHPVVTLRRSSSADWLEIRSASPDDDTGRRLVDRGCTCAPSPAGRSGTAGDRARLARMRRFHDRRGQVTQLWSYPSFMCRNITTLRGLEPQATAEEIEAAARQYVRKVSGVQSSSQQHGGVVRNGGDEGEGGDGAAAGRAASQAPASSDAPAAAPPSRRDGLEDRRESVPGAGGMNPASHDRFGPPVSLVGDDIAVRCADGSEREYVSFDAAASTRALPSVLQQRRGVPPAVLEHPPGCGLQVADVDRRVRGRSRRDARVRRPRRDATMSPSSAATPPRPSTSSPTGCGSNATTSSPRRWSSTTPTSCLGRDSPSAATSSAGPRARSASRTSRPRSTARPSRSCWR